MPTSQGSAHSEQSDRDKWGDISKVKTILKGLMTDIYSITQYGQYVLEPCKIDDYPSLLLKIQSMYKERNIQGNLIFNIPVLRAEHWILMEVTINSQGTKTLEYDSVGERGEPYYSEKLIKRNEQFNQWGCMDYVVQQVLRNTNKMVQIKDPISDKFKDAIRLDYKSGSGSKADGLREEIKKIILAQQAGMIKFRDLSQHENTWRSDFDKALVHKRLQQKKLHTSQQEVEQSSVPIHDPSDDWDFENDRSLTGYVAYVLELVWKIISIIFYVPIFIIKYIFKNWDSTNSPKYVMVHKYTPLDTTKYQEFKGACMVHTMAHHPKFNG